MPDIKVSQLPVATQANPSDAIVANQSGTTRTITVAQVISAEAATRAAADATLTASIATVNTNLSPLASPTFTGVPAAPTAVSGTSTTQIATTAFATTADLLRMRLTGADTMTGALNMGTHKINNVVDPAAAQDAATKNYVDTADLLRVTALDNYDPTGTSAYPVTHSPAARAAQLGDRYIITVAGSVNGKSVAIGDTLEALVNTPGNVTANWSVMQVVTQSATNVVVGLTRYATNAEALAESIGTAALTPSNLAVLVASTSQTGLAALATQAQANTGTDNTTIITPLTLQGKLNSIGTVQTVAVTIPTASVLTLNSVGYTVVPSPGVGLAILVLGATAQIKTYGGAAYATHTVLALKTDTADDAESQALITNTLLKRTAACIKVFQVVSGSDNNTPQLIGNKALKAYVVTGDPTAGSSDIVITCTYQTISV